MATSADTQQYGIDDLLYLMKRLRDPKTGCPWDLKQNFSSIAAYTLEEVYEVIDAIEREDYAHLGEELGDLLFQVVFYAQLGSEAELFDFNTVTNGIVSKLLVRHPHVFPDGSLLSEAEESHSPSTQAIKQTWEAIKKSERSSKGKAGILDDIPSGFPALIRAEKVQKRAANDGFDWPDVAPVLDKIEEEVAELRQAIKEKDKASIEDELGDVFFSLVNFSRHQGINAESALRGATKKFETRFRYIEQKAFEQGRMLAQLSANEMEQYWQLAKDSGL